MARMMTTQILEERLLSSTTYELGLAMMQQKSKERGGALTTTGTARAEGMAKSTSIRLPRFGRERRGVRELVGRVHAPRSASNKGFFEATNTKEPQMRGHMGFVGGIAHDDTAEYGGIVGGEGEAQGKARKDRCPGAADREREDGVEMGGALAELNNIRAWIDHDAAQVKGAQGD